MSDVTLKNISPLGAIQIPILRLEVEAGGLFSVPAEVAGREPVVDKNGVVTDPGEGLLAQVGNFELVNRKPEKKD